MCLLCPVSLYIDSFGSHENFKDITDTGRRLRRQTGSKLLRGGGNEGRKKEEEERKEKDCLFFVSIRSHSSVRWPAPARSPTCSPCARERECARFSLFSHLFPLPILRFLSPSFFPSFSLSLWPPWSSGSSYRVAARIVTHKLLSIVGDPRAECFCIPRARAPPFFRGDSLASGFAFHHRILLLFELLLLDRFIFPSEERNIDIDGVVCNFEGSCWTWKIVLLM